MHDLLRCMLNNLLIVTRLHKSNCLILLPYVALPVVSMQLPGGYPVFTLVLISYLLESVIHTTYFQLMFTLEHFGIKLRTATESKLKRKPIL